MRGFVDLRSPLKAIHANLIFDVKTACMIQCQNPLIKSIYAMIMLLTLSLGGHAMEKNHTEIATFAGGCFWGVEHYFQQISGVISAQSGYTGGTVPNPSYEQVCSGRTGHAEAVEIVFDPQKVSLPVLLKHFWRIHEPTSLNRQGNDVGTQYRSAIFYHSPQQLEIIQESIKTEQKRHSQKIVTEVAAAGKFYPAETYHQDYLVKNPRGYCHINMGLLKVPVE
jgi:methionine-S-sulfoxide reductase